MKHSVFNSLGSNYDLKFCLLALRQIFKTNKTASEILTKKLSQQFGGNCFLFYKGRDAIEFTLRACGIGRGDEVITQAFTCYAIEEAIIRAEASPVYCDIAENSLNPSEKTLNDALEKSENARALIIQYTLGHAAPIQEISAWCKEHNLLLIEDLAQAYGGFDKDWVSLGTYADAVVTSFGRDKIIDAVSGGAAILKKKHQTPNFDQTSIPTSVVVHDLLYPILTWKIRKTFDYGVGKVLLKLVTLTKFIDTPVKSRFDSIRPLPAAYAALVLYQLEKLEKQREHKQKIYQEYARQFGQFGNDASASWLRFPLIVNSPRDIIDRAKTSNLYISDRWYRQAVDAGSLNITSKYLPGSCPRAEFLAEHIINLPTHINIGSDQAQKIVDLIKTAQSEVKEVNSKEVWEEFIATHPEANFLQSWNWRKFHQNLGKKVYHVGLYENNNLKGVALAIVEKAKRSKHLTIAGGPILDWTNISQTEVSKLFDHLKNVAKKEDCRFIRLRLQELDEPNIRSRLTKLGFVQAPMHLTADHTLQLDLTKTEDQILKEMRKSTRYEINRAAKENIVVEISTDVAGIGEFYSHQLYLAQKHQFVPFSQKFLEEQFKAFAADNQVALFHAYKNGVLLATTFIIFYNGEAVYHYGVSTPAEEKLPGSYACLWSAIKEAKKRDCNKFNFWGIAPKDEKKHRFAGVALFKRGFGGEEVMYTPAHDLPLSQLYWLVYVFETFRRKWRKL